MASFAAAEVAPEYGRRLIPTLVDELAASNPDHVYASIPRNQDFTGVFDDVTYRTLARAVDRAAFWIESKVGRSVDFETIAYLGPSMACTLPKNSAKFPNQSTPDITSLLSPRPKLAIR